MRSRVIVVLMVVALYGAVEAETAVYEVGSGGGFSSIQGALAAAISAGGDNEVRVLQGTFNENLVISTGFSSGSLLVTGGWNAGFATRSNDPTLTVVNGMATDRVLEIRASGGTVEVRGLTLSNGAATQGAGAYIDPGGPATVVIVGCLIKDNVASGTPYGGGMYLHSPTGSEIDIVGNIVESNRSESDSGQATGGGIYGNSEGTGVLKILANRIRENTCHTDTNKNSEGAGAYIYAYDTSVVEFSDNVVTNNRSTGIGDALSFGASLGAWGTSSTLIARRNIFWNNISTKTGYFGAMLSSTSFHASTAVISDTIVAGSGGHGVIARAYGSSQVSLINLTVADIMDRALYLNNGSSEEFYLYNTITWNYGYPDYISGIITTGNNLTGGDPSFVDPASGNYQIASGSSAIGYGSNAAPGLGVTDVTGGDRVIGAAVDAGANEYANIFIDGFESSTVGRWSDTFQ